MKNENKGSKIGCNAFNNFFLTTIERLTYIK